MNTKRKISGRRQHANVTANDVARQAGVSPMTVSRVINDEANVRESTRTIVNEVIKDLGYSPNKAARSLASAKQIKVGILYSDPSSTYLSAMLFGLLEQARQSDTQVTVVSCDGGSATEDVLNGMIEDAVDGIILAPPLSDSRQAFEIVKAMDIPAVTIGSQHEDDRISSVHINDVDAARSMTEHLIALGHRRIGFIIGHPAQSASRQRLKGYRLAMRNAGIEVAEELVVQGEFSYQSGFEAADKLLKLDNRPTAIFACNDDMAAGAIATAHRHQIDVPKDLTVCGFDDTMLALTIWPAITTMRQPIAEMSKAAVGILDKIIRQKLVGQAVSPQYLEFDFSLIKRQSDGPPA